MQEKASCFNVSPREGAHTRLSPFSNCRKTWGLGDRGG